MKASIKIKKMRTEILKFRLDSIIVKVPSLPLGSIGDVSKYQRGVERHTSTHGLDLLLINWKKNKRVTFFWWVVVV